MLDGIGQQLVDHQQGVVRVVRIHTPAGEHMGQALPCIPRNRRLRGKRPTHEGSPPSHGRSSMARTPDLHLMAIPVVAPLKRGRGSARQTRQMVR
jgi:hypothetical protein